VTSGSDKSIEAVEFAAALEERYLAYALSTITSRSLPDARDGLKPVQRRLLYAMRELKLNPQSGFKKCARVVGDVIGKFHPHGDQAVYETLVRLAQEFSARYPLIEGQGNFGNVDGDNAAAMRYTEARLTNIAASLLEGIDEDAVDFSETYDGSESEPVVLPAGFPNLLANGATGIAVGMATSIPPHNVCELCDALLHVIKHPNATVEKLVDLVRGPDFPTGGVLVEPLDRIVEAYATGRGGFRLRAKWNIEELGRGQYQIIVSEIPYQVQKSRLIERIAELILNKTLSLVSDVRDESTDDIRLVIEPRSRSVDVNVLMETLFRNTDLETRISLNMNVLHKGHTPRVMNLRELLLEYLDHRHEVLVRRTSFRLERVERRLCVVEGYLVAFANLDEVIAIIREEDEPKPILMDRFKIIDIQAEAILDLRLRALRKLQRIELGEELKALNQDRKKLRALINRDLERWKVIAQQIRDVRKYFLKSDGGERRRTTIDKLSVPVPIPEVDLTEIEPITVVCSAKGWIRTLKGHAESYESIKYKDGDRERFLIKAQSADRLLFFGTNGRFYTLNVAKLPRGKGQGDPVRLSIDLPEEEDIVSLMVYRSNMSLLVGSSDGRGFLVKGEDVLAHTRTGKQVLNVVPPVEARICKSAKGDSIAIVGSNRKLLVFDLHSVPTMARGRGVLLQRYRGAELSDAKVFCLAEGLSWKTGARSYTKRDLSLWEGKRAQSGRSVPRGFSRSNTFE